MSLPTDLIQHTVPTLPGGNDYCFRGWQRLVTDIITRLRSTLRTEIGLFYMNSGPTTPAPENRVYPWLHPTGRVYQWSSGLWICEHPIPPGATGLRTYWFGSEADLATYDEGVNVAVGDTTGPFWTIDTSAAGRFVLAPGSLPGATTATTVAQGDTGGSLAAQLTAEMVPAHQHIVPVLVDDTWNPISAITPATEEFGIGEAQAAGRSVENNSGAVVARSYPLTSEYGDPTRVDADVDAVPVPAYIAGYLIKRTARRYYTLPG